MGSSWQFPILSIWLAAIKPGIVCSPTALGPPVPHGLARTVWLPRVAAASRGCAPSISHRTPLPSQLLAQIGRAEQAVQPALVLWFVCLFRVGSCTPEELLCADGKNPISSGVDLGVVLWRLAFDCASHAARSQFCIIGGYLPSEQPRLLATSPYFSSWRSRVAAGAVPWAWQRRLLDAFSFNEAATGGNLMQLLCGRRMLGCSVDADSSSPPITARQWPRTWHSARKFGLPHR